MRLPPLLLGLLLGVLVAAACAAMVSAVVVDAGTPSDRVQAQAKDEPQPGGGPVAPALDVLREWDAGRARAWSSADVAALRSLYTPGSAAGERDVSMLRLWRARGLRVHAMETQVVSAEVVTQSPDRVVLLVTDRLAHAVAAGRGERIRLPGDRESTRRVTLRRWHGSWLVASVLPGPVASAER